MRKLHDGPRDPEGSFDAERRALSQALARVASEPRILAAFRAVPRHLFVPETVRAHAYEDRALPLVQSQTISQPSMIAVMLDALRPEATHRALEVGGGSGYAAALLSRLVREVHTVELRPALAEMSRATLARAGIDNVTVHVGDGSKGLPDHAPFDRILVSAGAHHVPEELVRELSPTGRIVIPVDNGGGQILKIGQRSAARAEIEWETSIPCVFVPLVEEP